MASYLKILSSLELPVGTLDTLRAAAKSTDAIDKIYQQLRDTPWATSRSTVRQAISSLRTINTLNKSYNAQNYHTAPRAGLSLQSIGEQRARYSYEIKFTVRDKNTGMLTTISRNLSSDILLSKQEAVDTWLEHYASNNSTSNYDIVDYTISIPTEDITKA